MLLLKVLVTILGLCATSTLAVVNMTDYENNIIFYTWSQPGEPQLNFTLADNATFLSMCPPPANWTIISHAWQENLRKEKWTFSVVESFLKMRGGCVMFMDFDLYAKNGYSPMVAHVEGIGMTLVRRFRQLEELGYNPADGFLFGNGVSSHLFFLAAYNYSPCTIGRIDSCDAAKAQFFDDAEPVKVAKHAAKNVICYHTSRAYGTHLRYCQKNINFGRCGIAQPAVKPKTEFTNHELCPYFYNNTFTVDFDIVPKQTVHDHYKTRCRNLTVVPELMPGERIHVGPRMKTCIPNGEYYVLTEKDYPYNVPSKDAGDGDLDYSDEYDDNTDDDQE